MKISTKGRYGLRVLLDLAVHAEAGHPRLLRDVAQNQDISEKYLSRLVIDLRRAGLISSVRGAGGGYKLARPPKMITVLEILEVMEGPVAVVECVNRTDSCQRYERCPPRILWSQINQKIRNVFSEYTLQDLLDLQHVGGFGIDCVNLDTPKTNTKKSQAIP